MSLSPFTASCTAPEGRSSSARRRLPHRARLATPLALLPLLLPAPPAAAQAGALAPVTIVGNREPTALDRLVGDVVVIDAAQIRASSADSVEDLLRRVGGIQLSRNGGPGQNAAILLRGSGASSTLVLVDGVRIGSASLGQTDFAALGLAQIERIEILRGPGSSLYGADAVGGVVQIVTRRGAGAPRASAGLLLGELGSRRADASIAGASGAFDYAASVERDSSHGISAVKPNDRFGLFNPDRDGYARTNLQLRTGVTVAPDHRIGLAVVDSRLDAQYDGSEFLPPAFTPDATPDFRNRLRTRTTALDYRGTLTPSMTTSLQVSEQTDDLKSGANDVSRFETRRRQTTWQTAWEPTAGQQLVGAVEALEERVDATPYPSRQQRRNTALVLGYTGRFGVLKLQADARHDRNSAYGDVTTGKLGAAVDVGHGLTARVVAGSAFRAPTFNDLYFPGYGVPTIGPERARSVEVGLQWRGDGASVGITAYRNRVRDLIAYESDRTFCPAGLAYDFGCARNTDRATLQGATLEASRRFGGWALRATVDFLDAKDAATGQRLPRRAAHQESFGADRSAGAWTAGAELLRVGSRGESGVELPAYVVADFKLRYRVLPRWQLEARLTNAFDRRYEAQVDYPGVGRQAWIGIRYDGAEP